MKKKLVECASVPCRLTEETARKVDALAKGLPTGNQYKYRYKGTVAAEAEVVMGERSDVSKITTRNPDRDMEIVVPEGIDLEDYRRNPIVLFGHDQARPVGKAAWVKTDATGLLAKTLYPDRPEKLIGEWLADTVFALVQAEVLKGKSIGFLPLEIRDPSAEELEVHPGLQGVITRSLLLEYSVVSVPSNPEALVESIGKGIGLDLWNFKAVGRVKRKAQPVKKTAVYAPMADQLAHINLDVNEIADKAVKAILKRWEV